MGQEVLVGNGQGFWGDSILGPIRLVREGPLQYLTLDYLAEVTMSIMQKLKGRDPSKGYATDFISLLERILPDIVESGIKVIANAGGVNSAACMEAVLDLARVQGMGGLKVGIIEGDDIFAGIVDLMAQGERFDNMDDGRPLRDVAEQILSANVYIGAASVADCLAAGADIVIGGRITDPALVAGPLMHEFGWGTTDYDKLAAATVAGHIVECGAQCTGGNFSRWWEVQGWDRLGYPVLEVRPDGTFDVTKHDGTGGLVTVDSVAEQLLYEMGDPSRYVTPDVVADFTSIRLEQAGRDRVRVSDIRGAPATDSYKVSISYLEGYKAVGHLTVSGPDALAKAKVCAEALWGRLTRAGFDFDETRTEFLGVDSCHGSITPPPERVNEVVLRVGVKDGNRDKVDRFGKEIAPLVTSGPPGVTGFAGGRPKASEVLGFWPALISKDRVRPEVAVEEVR